MEAYDKLMFTDNKSTTKFEELWQCIVSQQSHKQHPKYEQRKEEESYYILLQ